MSYLSLGVVCAVSAIIAAWMLANSRYSIILRGFCAVVIMLLALTTWQHIGGLFGYPVEAMPLNDSMLVASLTEQGNRIIDIWVVPPGHHRPRAFAVPYSLRLAKQLKDAEDAMRHGAIVKLHTGGKGGHKGVHGAGEPNGGGHPGGIESSHNANDITITVKPLLPDKG